MSWILALWLAYHPAHHAKPTSPSAPNAQCQDDRTIMAFKTGKATITPTAEQEQRAKWDLLLLDTETRTEQLRQMKGFPAGSYEGWKVAFAGMSAGAAIFASGAAVTALLFHFWK